MNGGGVTIRSVGDDGSGGKTLLVVGAALFGFGIFLAASVPELGARIFGGIMAAIGLAFWWGWWKKKKVTDRLDPGVIDTDREQFTLGSRVPVRYRRLVKNGSTDTQSITARLVHSEWVRYRVGTDTRTATEDVQSFDLPVERAFDGRHVLGDLELVFPAYPPSFEAPDNKVRWNLHVHVTFLDGFTEDSVIPLWVIPAAMRSDLGGTPR